VSAGILLWLVSFHAVTPIGLVLARRAHISLSGSSLPQTDADGKKEERGSQEVPPRDLCPLPS
jgi:hypothetical protein